MKFPELKDQVRARFGVSTTKELKKLLVGMDIQADLRKRAHWEPLLTIAIADEQDNCSELDGLISLLAAGGRNRQYLEDIRRATQMDVEVLTGHLLDLELAGDIVLYPLNEGRQHWPAHVYQGMYITVPGAEWQDYRRILYWTRDQ